MLTCTLELGPDPWNRLEAGPVSGTAYMGATPALPVVAEIRGAHSRKFPLRSLQLTFPERRLPDEPPEGHSVRRLHLNADYIDPTLMRAALCFELFEALGVPAPQARHAQVRINGAPPSPYLALEAVDRDFCRRRGWKPGPIYYAVNRNANFGLINPFTKRIKERLEAGYKRVGAADRGPLRDMVSALNEASDADFPQVAERWIDTQGYLHWLMVAVFVGNRDGFVHNYALYLDPAQTRFQIIPWDYDATWGLDIHGRPARLDRVPVTGWNELTRRLLLSPAYRASYRAGFRAALDGPLSPTAVAERIDRLAIALAPWSDKILHDRQREGPYVAEIQRLKAWANDRRALLLRQLETLAP